MPFSKTGRVLMTRVKNAQRKFYAFLSHSLKYFMPGTRL
jgi:hypothetical protein